MSESVQSPAGGLEITASTAGQEEILTPGALDFLGRMTDRFSGERLRLLETRKERQQQIDQSGTLDFPEETRSIRESDWRVAELPEEALDRRTEITGPVSRKMVINNNTGMLNNCIRTRMYPE